MKKCLLNFGIKCHRTNKKVFRSVQNTQYWWYIILLLKFLQNKARQHRWALTNVQNPGEADLLLFSSAQPLLVSRSPRGVCFPREEKRWLCPSQKWEIWSLTQSTHLRVFGNEYRVAEVTYRYGVLDAMPTGFSGCNGDNHLFPLIQNI